MRHRRRARTAARPTRRAIPDHALSGAASAPPTTDGTVLPQQVWDSTAGIDLLHGWQAGTLPRSPLSNLMGAHVTEVEDGAITCTIPASPWFGGMPGTLYGGSLALLADYAMHGAVQSTLPAGTAWATLDLKIRYLRPVMPDGRQLQAHARVVHRGRRIAIVSVQIVPTNGKVSALADAAVMLLPHRPWLDLTQLTDEPHDMAT